MKRYLIVSRWKGSSPNQEPRDCLPEVEEVTEDVEKKALEKKKRLGPGSRVVIAEVIKEIKENIK